MRTAVATLPSHTLGVALSKLFTWDGGWVVRKALATNRDEAGELSKPVAEI